jgi:hypothetical protein
MDAMLESSWKKLKTELKKELPPDQVRWQRAGSVCQDTWCSTQQ